MPKWDFWGKQGVNWFKQNPQNINRKWRPKKSIAFAMWELEREGYTEISKREVELAYKVLLNLDEEKLKEVVSDKNQKMLIRICARWILSNRWFDIVEKMLDRWIWKPTQYIESQNINMEMTDKEKKLLKNLKKIANEWNK